MVRDGDAYTAGSKEPEPEEYTLDRLFTGVSIWTPVVPKPSSTLARGFNRIVLHNKRTTEYTIPVHLHVFEVHPVVTIHTLPSSKTELLVAPIHESDTLVLDFRVNSILRRKPGVHHHWHVYNVGLSSRCKTAAD